MSKHILIVDDDQLLSRSLAFNLEHIGYTVHCAATAADAFAQIEADPPLLILLDLGLPDMDGLEALRQLRGQVPVLILTARQRHLDEVLGLELGAEDYVTKPFEFDVLLARIRNILRRGVLQTVTRSRPLTIGALTIDPASHTVMLGEQTIELSPREFQLLHNLALNSGRVVPINTLITQVWGKEFVGEPQIIYVYIRALREKLEQNPQQPQHLITVRGIGYKLVP